MTVLSVSIFYILKVGVFIIYIKSIACMYGINNAYGSKVISDIGGFSLFNLEQ